MHGTVKQEILGTVVGGGGSPVKIIMQAVL